jgi:hypothetical protein
MKRIALVMMTLLACSTNKVDSAASGPPTPPLLLASGGKQMPEGYHTALRTKSGESLELAYTQITTLVYQSDMAIELRAEDGRMPAKALTVTLGMGTNKPVRVEDLVGRTLRPVRDTKLAFTPRRGSPSDEMTTTSARVTITKVTADAVDGTITAEFDGWNLAAAPFHACRAGLDDAALANLVQITP